MKSQKIKATLILITSIIALLAIIILVAPRTKEPEPSDLPNNHEYTGDEGYNPVTSSEDALAALQTYRASIAPFDTFDGLSVMDLAIGEGEVIEEGSTNYSAYYIVHQSDGSILDSSFDDKNNPTALKSPLPGSTNLIEGWKQGIVGMRIGGVRILNIPADLAYKEADLRFIVILMPKQ